MIGARPGLCAIASAFFIAAAPSVCAAEVVHVTMKSLVVSPARVSAKVGDTIEWANEDFVAHTATATDKSWEVMLPAHAKGHLVVSKPGTIAYFCRFHPNMKGEISVDAK
jgi:plastocyanin